MKNRLAIPYTEFEFKFAKSSGPGGQHANKSNTKVFLRWDFSQSVAISAVDRERLLFKYGGPIQLQSGRHRSQRQNIEDCIERLHQVVRRALAPVKVRVKTKPSKASKEKRLKEKKKLSFKKGMRRIGSE